VERGPPPFAGDAAARENAARARRKRRPSFVVRSEVPQRVRFPAACSPDDATLDLASSTVQSDATRLSRNACASTSCARKIYPIDARILFVARRRKLLCARRAPRYGARTVCDSRPLGRAHYGAAWPVEAADPSESWADATASLSSKARHRLGGRRIHEVWPLRRFDLRVTGVFGWKGISRRPPRSAVPAEHGGDEGMIP